MNFKRALAALALLGVLAIDTASAATPVTIANNSFESAVTGGVGALPTDWNAEPAGGLFNLNASGFGYAGNTNGLLGSQVTFNTGGGMGPGTGINQEITGEKAVDNATYTMTVGIGERNFSRFSGVVLELRLADGTVLGTETFSSADISPLFVVSGGDLEVVDAVATFAIGDVDNLQDIEVAIFGATAGNGSGTEDSLDIDNIRLEYTPATTPTHHKLFILTGQSNSLGVTNGGETDPTSGVDIADGNILFAWHNRVNDTTSLGHSGLTLPGTPSTANFTTYQDQQGGVYAGSATHWGPETEFARSLYRAGVRDFGIIKVSRGGGGNTFWHKDSSGHMYTRITTTVAEAVASLPAGDTYEIVGLLYLQGESDSSEEAAIAGTRAKELVDNLRTDLTNASSMHMVIGGIATSSGSRATVQQNQAAIASITSYIDYFETIDQQTNLHDGLHYNKEAKITVGQRYATAFFDTNIVSRHYGKLVFIGDSITQGGNGDHPSYRYQVFKNLATAGVPINEIAGYKFVGSVNGGYLNSSMTTPDVNGQTFENNHDGHFGWRGSWENGRLPIPTNRHSNNRGEGNVECWTGQATLYESGSVGNFVSYPVPFAGSGNTGTTYIPDTAVIMIGINDVSDSVAATQIRDDIGTMIDQLRGANGNVRIHVNQLLYSNNVSSTSVDAVNSLLPALVATKNTASPTSPVWLIDTNDGFNATTMTYDNTHPNAVGEEFVGDKIATHLGTYINIVPPTPEPGVIEKGSASLTNCFVGSDIFNGTSYVNGWSVTTPAAIDESNEADLNRTHASGAASWLDGTASTTDGGTTTWNTGNSGDWTYETRMKINDAPNGFVMWLGTDTDIALFYIYNDRTEGDASGPFTANHTNNDGEFHTWRVAYNSSTIKYQVWRDDTEITPVGGVALNTLNHSNLIMGDSTGGSVGDNYDVDIDYVRYDQTGTYTPVAKESSTFPSTFESIEIYNGSSFINGWTEVTASATSETLVNSTLGIDHTSGAGAWIEGTSATKDAGNTSWSSINSGDWTWETRMRINDATDGLLLWLGTGSDIAYISILNDRTENYTGSSWSKTHTVNANNDGEFHTWRVIHDSNNSKYHVWRDGERLTPTVGASFDSGSNDSRMIIGDFTGESYGDNFNIDIDYICYDQTGAYLPTGADADSDGMPDSWEYLRFGDVTSGVPGEDDDNDDLTNLEEYHADTDPNDATSRAYIESIVETANADEFDITIPDTSPQRNYTLYESDDLGITDAWTAISTPTIGTDGDLIFTLSTTTEKFYRVEVTIP